jgi:exosortase J
MATLPQSQVDLRIARPRALSPVQFAALGTSFAVLGVVAIRSAMDNLWTLWTTDAMKSIGIVVPLVSLVLVLRAWRAIGWAAEGTWWGLIPLLAAMAAERLQERAVLILVISPHWSTPLPPPSLVLLIYGAGVVLLLGGVRLFRAALFPILLLWFANPVPHAFSLLVDMPLQAVSAHIARSFAMALGQSLTPDRLRLMFTPQFGMFIAPGCDGIRGSVTMGFIALIAGYVYRFRWYANTLVVAGAVLLGYLFNLARLCSLVLYYLVALHIPWLQDKAESADYAIGAALFLVATLLLFGAIHRLRGAPSAAPSQAAAVPGPRGFDGLVPRAQIARLAAIGAIALVGFAGVARAGAAHLPGNAIAGPTALQFPTHLGNYTLAHTWNESTLNGTVVYVWAQYSRADGGTPVAVGVSPVFNWHDPLICHATRGEHPLWQGQLTIATAGAVPIDFSSGFYDDGVTQHIEASTQCNGASCGEFATERTHFGFVYSRLDPSLLFGGAAPRSVPVLLRAETLDTATSGEAVRQQLTQDLRAFLASVSLDDLTRPYSH